MPVFLVKLQGDESLSKEYTCFWQNFRKKGKKVSKGGGGHFLMGETHKVEGKYSGGPILEETMNFVWI